MASRVYKVVAAKDWATACQIGRFNGSADDLRDAFIHLSSAAQVQGTLKKYFMGQTDLVLVAFDATDFGSALKWEASRGGDLFPHLYGPLSTNLAVWQRKLTLSVDGVAYCDMEWFEC